MGLLDVVEHSVRAGGGSREEHLKGTNRQGNRSDLETKCDRS
jgi:hypothetical protein